MRRAREGILSRIPAARGHALQEFWGAFDYPKTADVPGRGNKRKSIDVLLARLPTDEMRQVVNADMNALKEAGNTFRIRHHETDAVDLTESEKDYLAGRMANVLLMLLRASARLTPAQATALLRPLREGAAHPADPASSLAFFTGWALHTLSRVLRPDHLWEELYD